MQTGEFQRRGFRKSAHDVEALDRLSPAPLDKIVDRGKHNHAAGICFELAVEIELVRPPQELGFRIPVDSFARLHETDEGLITVGLPVQPPEVDLLQWTCREDVGCDQQSADNVNCGR